MTGAQKYGRILRPIMILVISVFYPFTGYAQEDLPDKPDMVRVTVDSADNGVLVQWEASTDNDIEWYHIYNIINRTGHEIAVVTSNVLEYKYMGGGVENLAYTVTAEDTSGNESLLEDNEHRAVIVATKFNPCIPENVMTWTGYEGWDNNISGYKIYGGRSGEEMKLLEFVHFNTRSFAHKGVDINTNYTYFVETVNISGLTSLSPIDTIKTAYPRAPGFLTMDYVSIIDRSTIELQFTADIDAEVNDFRVMRRSNPGTPYSEVQTILNATETSTVIRDQVRTFETNYEYIVQSVYQPVECSSPIIISESNPGTSILLGGVLRDQITTLTWYPYETYNSGLSGYIVQRRSGNGEFHDVGTVGPGTTTWSESVQSVINGFQPGELQYKVIAVSNLNGEAGPYQSVSNIVSITVVTDLQVPSAFTPGSNDMNFEFKPIIDFAPKKYILVIFDRGGRKLFETTDPGEGWDGRFRNGELVNEGVYVYYIQYTDYTGLYKSFAGNLTVLYP